MIQAYPQADSVAPGDTLRLYVSTEQPRFRVEFYRQGKTLEHKVHPDSAQWKVGVCTPKRPSNETWGWSAYEFIIPGDWPSGAYIAMLYEGDTEGNQLSAPKDITSADGREAKALFVVKSATPGQSNHILYKLSLFTYHAYNAEGDPTGSLYQEELYQAVTLLRPGGGTGGSPYDMNWIDVYDTTSPRQTFAHWDAPFITWLETNGYNVDYCTDYDVHRNLDNFLSQYRLLLSVGHDEYWSESMRRHIEGAIRSGLNVAYFSANTSYWRVTFDDEVTYGHRTKWYKVKNPESHRPWPENSMTGVSYRNGGGRWAGEREAVGFAAQHTDHWIYAGTGLGDGDEFGKNQHLIGYEFDGARLYKRNGLLTPIGDDGTPLTFLVLGIGKIHPRGTGTMPPWRVPYDIDAEILGDHQATMGMFVNGGCVFTAATVDWTRVLAAGEPVVTQITRNVLDRLQARSVTIVVEAVEAAQSKNSRSAFVMEGQTVTFGVNKSGWSDADELHYQWTVSYKGHNLEALPDHPTLQVKMPSPPEYVTITVTITAEADRCWFGTLTLLPASASLVKRWAERGNYYTNRFASSMRKISRLAMHPFRLLGF